MYVQRGHELESF